MPMNSMNNNQMGMNNMNSFGQHMNNNNMNNRGFNNNNQQNMMNMNNMGMNMMNNQNMSNRGNRNQNNSNNMNDDNASNNDIAAMDPRQLTRTNISLSQLIDANVIEKLARDQNGSRFIQQRLETASLQDKEGVFAQIRRNALALCEDVFGNYVIQKFFEHGR